MRIRPILCWEFSSAISNAATAPISKSCSRKLRHIEHSFPLECAPVTNDCDDGGRSRSKPTRSFWVRRPRSEEHTSELQSHSDLVCRLLLEKKKLGKI